MNIIVYKPSITIFSFVDARVPAGFPSPADDYLESRLSLDELIIEHPSSTFFAKIEGESMSDIGISSGDIAVIDKSLNAQNGDIILAWINEGYTVKKLVKVNDKVFLEPANKRYKPIEVTEEMEARIWGVVTCVIKRFR